MWLKQMQSKSLGGKGGECVKGFSIWPLKLANSLIGVVLERMIGSHEIRL